MLASFWGYNALVELIFWGEQRGSRAALGPCKAVGASSPREIRPQSERGNGHPALPSGEACFGTTCSGTVLLPLASPPCRGNVGGGVCLFAVTRQAAAPAAARREGDARAPTPMLFQRSLMETTFGGCGGGFSGASRLSLPPRGALAGVPPAALSSHLPSSGSVAAVVPPPLASLPAP